MRKLHVFVIALILVAAAAAFAFAQGSEETTLAPTAVTVTKRPLIVEDPEGPPHFVLRTYERHNDLCLRYGRQGKDRLLPPHNITCQDRTRRPHLPVELTISASGGKGARTIISGLVDPSVKRVTVAGPGPARTFEFD